MARYLITYSNQIAPESYLGWVLENVDKHACHCHKNQDPGSLDSPDSSSESSSSESTDDSERSDSLLDSPHAKK
jgi:hypothetical protein